MTAGILSYQLCNRQFDCENCPLDKAMRMHFSPGSHGAFFNEQYHCELPSEDCLFSRDHCWVKNMNEDIIRVGLEPGFAAALISPKAIALPSVGENVEPGKFCCWIILEGETIPLRSPVSGKIVTTNARIADEPHEICQRALTSGWLFEVQVYDQALEADNLMTKEEADQCYSRDFTRFTTMLNEALRENNMQVGMTMQDGGAVLRNVSDIIGAKKYCELLRTVFLAK